MYSIYDKVADYKTTRLQTSELQFKLERNNTA